jgi:hypothetical protein
MPAQPVTLAPQFYAVRPAAALLAAGAATVTDLDGIGRFTFHGAVVHGPSGVVTVGRSVVEETLLHVFPEGMSALRDGPVWMMQAPFAWRRIDAAEHLLCGNGDNYYHYLLDGLVRWRAAPPCGLPAILPWTGRPFQQEVLPLLPGLAQRGMLLSAGHAIEVERLLWLPNLTGAGHGFHPAIRSTAAAIRSAIHIVTPGPPDLYISRRDSTNRHLVNEAEVEAFCVQRGFIPVQLAGMPAADQVALFAGARRIVAPHGAGLANLLFCEPGTSVLELQMEGYDAGCFRNLANTMGLVWRQVSGPMVSFHEWVHCRSWTLPLDRLAAAWAGFAE